jgi:hypothetical protein
MNKILMDEKHREKSYTTMAQKSFRKKDLFSFLSPCFRLVNEGFFLRVWGEVCINSITYLYEMVG